MVCWFSRAFRNWLSSFLGPTLPLALIFHCGLELDEETFYIIGGKMGSSSPNGTDQWGCIICKHTARWLYLSRMKNVLFCSNKLFWVMKERNRLTSGTSNATWQWHSLIYALSRSCWLRCSHVWLGQWRRFIKDWQASVKDGFLKFMQMSTAVPRRMRTLSNDNLRCHDRSK